MGVRFILVVVFFATLYGWLGFRFYNIQIRQGDFYSAQAASQMLGRSLEPVRGDIIMTDRDGSPVSLAITKNHPFIYASPEQMAREGVDLDKAATQLELVIGVPAADIMRRINNPRDPFVELLRSASDEIVLKVKELNIPGVYIGERTKRYYPYGVLAAHILGFVANNKGQYGVEAYFNKRLSGIAGRISGTTFIAPERGQDIQLTINPIIQSRAEKILASTITKFNAKGGVVIVSEPRTGAIKAMAGAPSFDPNNFGSAKMSRFINPAVQKVYEPGSVFKLITMAAALSSGSVTPDTTYIDYGTLTRNGRVIRNWNHRAHGELTMREVIERSINTGTVFAVEKMGRKTFLNYLEKFGFTAETGINLPGEVVGSIRSLINGRDINFATASYGQGISVTPISMLTAINAIANNGVMMRPRIIKGESEVLGRPISSEVAKTMTDIMVSSVERNVLADIKGYSVAGKTGTAQAPDLVMGGYRDAYINTYIGFAPAHNPRFSILIRIDEPEGNPLAGESVVPAFRDLAEFILLHYGIAPDKLES